MDFEKMNHETLFVTTERHSNGYGHYPTVKTKMPSDRESVELNFYYNCPVRKTGKIEYVLNETQKVIDQQKFIAKACKTKFGFRNPKLLPTVRFMYIALHIITMTKHTFHKETGTITSEQPQVIYAEIATKDKGSAFQIMFWAPENTPDLQYKIHDGDVRGSGWNVCELAVEQNIGYMISVTSYAFTFKKIDYQKYCNSSFNDQYSEAILWDENMKLMESTDYTQSMKGLTCALTIAAEYNNFDGKDYLGNSNLHESIKFLA